jgi:hypothetical protein
MRLVTVGLAFAFTLGASGCQHPLADCGAGGCQRPIKPCVIGDIGYTPLFAYVVDRSGTPIVLATTVKVIDGPYTEIDLTSANVPWIPAAGNRGGHTYDVLVTKPFYEPVWVRGVYAPSPVFGACIGDNVPAWTPTAITVTLDLVPNAPPVRSLRLLPNLVALDSVAIYRKWQLAPSFDADATVSRDVTWRAEGDTDLVRLDQTGTVSYRTCTPNGGRVKIIATSVADSTVRGTATAVLQGHPGC